ncbi:hypothetical protein GUJ93_ZPchr0014g46593 [Zizania palustris]|uniref:Uncharacterized protein n=1 Tax=Zizania palustris TaxID=103762 RepID=A0A8J5W0K9_ZIZPA|nr:hypothetical protein GUJ93_ZPchr0014g46593 [Zizania palustris]
MGLSPSKRVDAALRRAPAFAAACDAAFDRCLADARHAFSGVRPYQLADASADLHASLRGSLPLVRRWAPSPPPRALVDSALRAAGLEGAAELSRGQFEEFAAELFRDAVLAGAAQAALVRAPAGAAGLVGVGLAARAGAGAVFRLPASLPPPGRLPFAASPHLFLRPPPRLPVTASTPSARLPASRWPPPCLPVAASVPPGGRLRTLRLVDSSAPSASRWLPPRLPVVASASSAHLRPPLGGDLRASRWLPPHLPAGAQGVGVGHIPRHLQVQLIKQNTLGHHQNHKNEISSPISVLERKSGELHKVQLHAAGAVLPVTAMEKATKWEPNS